MSLAEIRLDDKYRLATGHLYLTGTQALTRLPMLQKQRDAAHGLNTACFISGYRGSPLGGLDKSLWDAKQYLKDNHIHFQPGVNEELAATSVWGSQQTSLFPGARYDGVFAMWYGKGPGVDRCGDVFKHGNSAGVSEHGGVLLLAGDDHGCKSSSIANQSEHAFIAASIPVLNPANVQEILDYGIIGWALSRYSGCWVALKTIAENVDSSAVVDVDPLRMQVLAPIQISPHDPNTVYFGAQSLYRSRDRGDTWEKLSADMSYNDKAKIGDVPHQLVITISESPKKKGLIYTGTDDGRLWASVDDGKEFRELTANLPEKQWIAKVVASQHDEGTVYVAQQGRYDEDFAPRMYKSTDYGKTITNIGGNIPGGPINMIREDPVSPHVLYAANDFGVYVTTNGGARWEVLGGNLPSVAVMDFIVHPRDRMLVIGTHGRGVWTIDVSKIGSR